MNQVLQQKLKQLPNSPGVYFHKSASGEVIYVGKAAVLKNRVRQYFQHSRNMDIKTCALVKEIADTDWIETESEIDALFLEAEMIKRYKPQFNILLRDDKSSTFIRINLKDATPYVSLTRNPIDDGAEYFGPYYNRYVISKALRYLRRIFPFFIKPQKEGERPNLDSHLGLNPVGLTNKEYKNNLKKLISYIKGNRKTIIAELEKEMKQYAKVQDFEKATVYRNKLRNLQGLQQRVMFGDKEFLDISKDFALNDLTELLGLKKVPTRIEGYDISHMSGTNVVASMVVFTNGASDRSNYRKFKISKDRNDDFLNMKEVLTRRFSPTNCKKWGVPDLILIDGGKGQLNAALQVRNNCQQVIPMIGLAKRDEQIVVKCHDKQIKLNQAKLDFLQGTFETTEDFYLINLPKSSHIIKLLQRVRDESHRFAITYHSQLKRKNQTKSLLDDITGIGPKTKVKLLRRYGSLEKIKQADKKEIEALIGKNKAQVLKDNLA